MIKRASEMPRTVKPQMRGGDGQAVVTNLLDAGEYQGKSRMIATIRLVSMCMKRKKRFSISSKALRPMMTTAKKQCYIRATLAFAWAVKSTRLPTGQRMKRLFCMR